MNRNYCAACGYIESHDPNCALLRPKEYAVDSWDLEEVEDRFHRVFRTSDLQAAWQYLVDHGVPSHAATAGVRFMDGHVYGPPVYNKYSTFRVSLIDEDEDNQP